MFSNRSLKKCLSLEGQIGQFKNGLILAAVSPFLLDLDIFTASIDSIRFQSFLSLPPISITLLAQSFFLRMATVRTIRPLDEWE
jgi:hypothetical protein